MGVSGLVSRGSRAAGKFVELTDRVVSPGHGNISAELRSMSKHDVQAVSLPVVGAAGRGEHAGGLSEEVGVPGDWGSR